MPRLRREAARWSDRLSGVLFEEGWRFFVPYLLPYLAYRALGGSTALLRTGFEAGHVAVCLLLLRFAWQRRARVSPWDAAFWAALAVLLTLPGAYLEFPSDPWEHVRRIYAWDNIATLDRNGFGDRFSYFWNWTRIGRLAPVHRRPALALLSGFYQLLLAYQLHRVARRLGASPAWAKVQVLAAVMLFGHYFSFFRYFALASTSLAYVAYLRALISGLDLAEGRRTSLLDVVWVLLLMRFDHQQELVLLCVSSLGLLGHFLWRLPATRSWLTRALPGIGIGAILLLTAWLLRGPVEDYPPRAFFVVLGVHGIAAQLVAILFWRRFGALSTLCLLPTLLLAFPPTAAAIPWGAPDVDQRWRLMLAFPTSFALIAALRVGLSWARRRAGAGAERGLAVVAAAALIAVSLRPESPYRGRLWFVLHQPSPDLSLGFVDETAQWFAEHRGPGSRAPSRLSRAVFGSVEMVAWNPPPYEDKWKTDPSRLCIVVSDNATAFALGTHLGSLFGSHRRAPTTVSVLVENPELFLDMHPVCGVLISRAGPEVGSVPSTVARMSGHWQPDLVYQDLHVDFGSLPQSLARRGWTATAVPPFYELWEPPVS